MDGLDYFGASDLKEKLKKNAPYIGAGAGALVGGLLGAFTRFLPLPRIARIGVGATVGGGAGFGTGYAVKKYAGGSKEKKKDEKGGDKSKLPAQVSTPLLAKK